MSRPALLFVDDDPSVLSGLRRQLYDRRAEWDLCFFDDPPAAVGEVERRAFDVVVSDMRMPGMDGAELLAKVRALRPEAMRIILTGYAEPQQSMRVADTAHQFLSKPCEPAALRDALAQAVAVGRLVPEGPLKHRLADLAAAPFSPGAAEAVLAELGKPEASLKAAGELVERDPGLSVKLLQVVNSAWLGLPQRVTRPAQAARLLGLEALRGLLHGLRRLRSLGACSLDPCAERRAWEHGLAVAGAARAMVKGRGEEVEAAAFLAGILHDAGSLALATLGGGAPPAEPGSPAVPGHAAVGAFILGHWGMPLAVVAAVGAHHDPLEPEDPVAAALHRAEALTEAVELEARNASSLKEARHEAHHPLR